MNQRVDQIWPDWSVVGYIDAGSYGKVYRVRKEQAGSVATAAMKVIEVPHDATEVQRLMDEGLDSVAIFDHYAEEVRAISQEISLLEELKGNKSIVHIEDFEVNEHDDGSGWTICLRMELLDSLVSHIRTSGNPSREEVVRLGCDICQALEACERLGIVHRDIKPSNIFIGKDGQYKLGDFGIATHLDAPACQGQPQTGTSAYMAPEVYFGRPSDGTADIYSLGIVMYRLLDWANQSSYALLGTATAKVRFWEAEGEREQARLGGRPLAPPADAPDELSAIVLRAVSPVPEDRYASAAEMRLALEGWLKGDERHAAKPVRDQMEQCLAQGIARYEAQDFDKAVELLERAYRAGYAQAGAYLGICYLRGRGRVRDTRQGFDLLLEAANAGDTMACIELGSCYEQGTGTSANAAEAYAWYLRAHEAGNLKGTYALARCLEGGIGTAQDRRKALSLYEELERGGGGTLAQQAHDRAEVLRDELEEPAPRGLGAMLRQLFFGGRKKEASASPKAVERQPKPEPRGRHVAREDSVETVLWEDRRERPALLRLTRLSTAQQYELRDEGRQLTIGRYGTDILLGDDNLQISRSHAKFVFDAGRVYVVDTGSANGTYLNGECLAQNQWYPLKAGDSLALADEQFRLSEPSSGDRA